MYQTLVLPFLTDTDYKTVCSAKTGIRQYFDNKITKYEKHQRNRLSIFGERDVTVIEVSNRIIELKLLKIKWEKELSVVAVKLLREESDRGNNINFITPNKDTLVSERPDIHSSQPIHITSQWTETLYPKQTSIDDPNNNQQSNDIGQRDNTHNREQTLSKECQSFPQTDSVNVIDEQCHQTHTPEATSQQSVDSLLLIQTVKPGKISQTPNQTSIHEIDINCERPIMGQHVDVHSTFTTVEVIDPILFNPIETDIKTSFAEQQSQIHTHKTIPESMDGFHIETLFPDPTLSIIDRPIYQELIQTQISVRDVIEREVKEQDSDLLLNFGDDIADIPETSITDNDVKNNTSMTLHHSEPSTITLMENCIQRNHSSEYPVTQFDITETIISNIKDTVVSETVSQKIIESHVEKFDDQSIHIKDTHPSISEDQSKKPSVIDYVTSGPCSIASKTIIERLSRDFNITLVSDEQKDDVSELKEMLNECHLEKENLFVKIEDLVIESLSLKCELIESHEMNNKLCDENSNHVTENDSLKQRLNQIEISLNVLTEENTVLKSEFKDMLSSQTIRDSVKDMIKDEFSQEIVNLKSHINDINTEHQKTVLELKTFIDRLNLEIINLQNTFNTKRQSLVRPNRVPKIEPQNKCQSADKTEEEKFCNRICFNCHQRGHSRRSCKRSPDFRVIRKSYNDLRAGKFDDFSKIGASQNPLPRSELIVECREVSSNNKTESKINCVSLTSIDPSIVSVVEPNKRYESNIKSRLNVWQNPVPKNDWRRIKVRKCFNCNRVGHEFRDCPKQPDCHVINEAYEQIFGKTNYNFGYQRCVINGLNQDWNKRVNKELKNISKKDNTRPDVTYNHVTEKDVRKAVKDMIRLRSKTAFKPISDTNKLMSKTFVTSVSRKESNPYINDQTISKTGTRRNHVTGNDTPSGINDGIAIQTKTTVFPVIVSNQNNRNPVNGSNAQQKNKNCLKKKKVVTPKFQKGFVIAEPQLPIYVESNTSLTNTDSVELKKSLKKRSNPNPGTKTEVKSSSSLTVDANTGIDVLSDSDVESVSTIKSEYSSKTTKELIAKYKDDLDYKRLLFENDLLDSSDSDDSYYYRKNISKTKRNKAKNKNDVISITPTNDKNGVPENDIHSVIDSVGESKTESETDVEMTSGKEKNECIVPNNSTLTSNDQLISKTLIPINDKTVENPVTESNTCLSVNVIEADTQAEDNIIVSTNSDSTENHITETDTHFKINDMTPSKIVEENPITVSDTGKDQIETNTFPFIEVDIFNVLDKRNNNICEEVLNVLKFNEKIRSGSVSDESLVAIDERKDQIRSSCDELLNLLNDTKICHNYVSNPELKSKLQSNSDSILILFDKMSKLYQELKNQPNIVTESNIRSSVGQRCVSNNLTVISQTTVNKVIKPVTETEVISQTENNIAISTVSKAIENSVTECDINADMTNMSPTEIKIFDGLNNSKTKLCENIFILLKNYEKMKSLKAPYRNVYVLDKQKDQITSSVHELLELINNTKVGLEYVSNMESKSKMQSNIRFMEVLNNKLAKILIDFIGS